MGSLQTGEGARVEEGVGALQVAGKRNRERIEMTTVKWGKIGLDGTRIEKTGASGVTPLRINEGNGPTVCGWELGKSVMAKVETRVFL